MIKSEHKMFQAFFFQKLFDQLKKNYIFASENQV